jgi:hypothetical protein
MNGVVPVAIHQSSNPPIHSPSFQGGFLDFFDGIALQWNGLGLFLD